jgi:hypothetical protein
MSKFQAPLSFGVSQLDSGKSSQAGQISAILEAERTQRSAQGFSTIGRVDQKGREDRRRSIWNFVLETRAVISLAAVHSSTDALVTSRTRHARIIQRMN